jgi:hypothetical protein
VSEENESTVSRLLFGDGDSELQERVLQYIAHRLKEGANLREVLKEEYVVRNSTEAERDEILRDPRVVQQDREGLEEHFESNELTPEHRTAAAKGQRHEDPRQTGPLTGTDTKDAGPTSTGV